MPTPEPLTTLAFDSETTGKSDFRAPAGAPSQPHIVQLGAILYDENRRVVGEMNYLVKPDGWTIPAEATEIHGITTEMCERFGLPLKTVIMTLLCLARRAKRTAAHNRPFDDLMVRTALIRLGFTKELEEWEALSKAGGCCTMEAMTPVCKLPGRRGFKWPTLQEAHTHAFGVGFEGAHDAMIDVRSCAKVLFWHDEQVATGALKEAA